MENKMENNQKFIFKMKLLFLLINTHRHCQMIFHAVVRFNEIFPNILMSICSKIIETQLNPQKITQNAYIHA